MKKYTIILLIIFFILILSCPDDNQAAGAKGRNGSTLRTDSGMAPALEDNTDYAAMEAVKLPKDFPGDIHLYANARNIKSFKSDKGFSVTLFTPDTLEKVVADYREYAELAQWQDEKVLELSNKTVLKYKVDGRILAVQVAQKQGGCLITISTK